jgi:putative spermidine/putrescine transport system permease protein
MVLQRIGRAALWVVTAAIVVFSVLPSLIVIPISVNPGQFIQFPPSGFSLHWYHDFVSQSAWTTATLHTIVVSLLAAVIATVVGTLAAVSLVRGDWPFRDLIRSFFLVPMVMPTMILALGLYRLFADAHLIGSVVGLALAYAMLGVPLVVLTVTAGLQAVDERLEHAARSLGATPMRAFLGVTVPLLRPSIIAGAIFAFIVAFDEVVIATFLSGTSAVTLPLQMWLGLRFEVNPVIPAASTVTLLTAVLLYFALDAWQRRTRVA